MSWRNRTVLSEFILLGLTSEPKANIFLFVFILILFITILFGNFLIVFLTIKDSTLQTPMYFFLTNLSFLDILYSTSVVPRMLKDLLSVTKTISFAECAAQMYVSLSLGECECILLAVMAYDRYIAICYPLHYTTIISRSVCIQLSAGTWICGFLLSISHVSLTLSVNVCGQNEIDHFACEVTAILSLTCEDIFIVEFVIFVVGVVILITPVTFIIITYIKIIMTIKKNASSVRQQKAFSTCGSHLLVVTIFFGSAMITYMKPRSNSSQETDKIISICYCIITPVFNPLVYTLRNHDVKAAIKKLKIRNLCI